MIKKLFFISFVFILIGKTTTAQIPQNKWWIVQDLPDKIVYIDTSAIKLNENQISVWSLVVYRSPIKLNAFKEEISRIKSQYLFNVANKKYAVLGTLYYDNKSRIVGESISPAITGSGERFTLIMQPASPVEKVFEKAQEYLRTGSLKSLQSDTAGTETQDEENTAADNSANEETRFEQEPAFKLPDDPLSLDTFEDAVPKDRAVDTSSIEDEEKDENAPPVNPLIMKSPTGKDIIVDNEAEIKNVETQVEVLNPGERRVYDPISGKYVTVGGTTNTEKKTEVKTPQTTQEEKPKTETKEEPKRETPKVTAPVKSGSYNSDSEQNVKGNIWSDGNIFAIQISSWKSKNIADREAQKLKTNGHNSFVMEKFISSKNATYYRVRVGYFNSLQEAEEYIKKLR